MAPQRATTAQRIGIWIAVLEACLLAFVAALHFGFRPTLGGTTFAAPFLYPAAIVEAILAVCLLVSVVVPGRGGGRSGRVLVAQVLVLLAVFASQVALARGWSLTTARSELLVGIILVLALSSLVLVASPIMRRADAGPLTSPPPEARTLSSRHR